MFDIGFWELALIGVVALIVIGPEKLPGLARTAGMWVGKARSVISNAKADIEQEIKAEELKRIIEEQTKANMNSIHEIVEETKSAVDDTGKQSEYLVKAIPDEEDAAPDKPVTKKPDDGSGQ
jgi:sec-independent protein translocase protein TatB